MCWLRPFLLLGLLLASAFPARAQSSYILPLPFGGQGTISIGASSTPVIAASITLTGANSSNFPAANSPLPTSGLLRVKPQGGAVTVCWQGGTCTVTNGEVLQSGESRTIALPQFSKNPVTMFAASTTSVELEW